MSVISISDITIDIIGKYIINKCCRHIQNSGRLSNYWVHTKAKQSIKLLVPLCESYFSKSILKSPQMEIVLLSVTWLNRRSMLPQKTAKSDLGALYRQAITTIAVCQLQINSNTLVIAVDLLDVIEQSRESLTYSATPPPCL